jgi:hypothetical protein
VKLDNVVTCHTPLLYIRLVVQIFINEISTFSKIIFFYQQPKPAQKSIFNFFQKKDPSLIVNEAPRSIINICDTPPVNNPIEITDDISEANKITPLVESKGKFGGSAKAVSVAPKPLASSNKRGRPPKAPMSKSSNSNKLVAKVPLSAGKQ